MPSILKLKQLRLISPEHANELGIPAEAPVLVSPYISREGDCIICNVKYRPLMYQVGFTTKAHHTCKENGGIYTQLYEDESRKWVYTDGLFRAHVIPHGPIRMGDDKGYTFESVTVKRILPVHCIYNCGKVLTEGVLIDRVTTNAVRNGLYASCNECHDMSDWRFRIWDDGRLTFSMHITLPANAGITR